MNRLKQSAVTLGFSAITALSGAHANAEEPHRPTDPDRPALVEHKLLRPLLQLSTGVRTALSGKLASANPFVSGGLGVKLNGGKPVKQGAILAVVEFGQLPELEEGNMNELKEAMRVATDGELTTERAIIKRQVFTALLIAQYTPEIAVLPCGEFGLVIGGGAGISHAGEETKPAVHGLVGAEMCSVGLELSVTNEGLTADSKNWILGVTLGVAIDPLKKSH